MNYIEAEQKQKSSKKTQSARRALIQASSPEDLQMGPNSRILLDNLGDGIAVLQEDRIVYCSPRLVKLSGYAQKALLQQSFSGFIHADDLAAVKKQMAALYSRRRSASTTFRVFPQEGRCRWLGVRLIYIAWRGQPALLMFVSDISEQHAAEEALRLQLGELQTLQRVTAVCFEAPNPDVMLKKVTRIIGKTYASGNLGIVLLDEAQKMLHAHPSYQHALPGYLKIGKGIVGRVALTGMPLRIGDVRREKNYLQVDPATRSELCVPLKIGNRVLGAINAESPQVDAFTAADERLLATAANMLAIALDRMKAESGLHASESKYRLLFEQSKDVVFLCAPDSSVIDCNRNASHLLGFSKEELLNRTYRQLMAPEYHHDSRNKLAQIKKGIEVPPYEKVMIGKDGRRIPIELSPVPVFDSRGRMIWFQSVIRDISERKEAERLQSALYRISEVSNSTRDLDQLYAAIHRIVGELMNADNFLIALYDSHVDLLRFPYFIDQQEGRPETLKPGKELAAYVLHTGKPLLANRQQLKELERQGHVVVSGPHPIDWLGVPLKDYEGRVFGVLAVRSYDSKIRYTRKEKSILTFVSQQIAAVIEHKASEEKQRETESRFQQLEKMETIGTLVSSITHDFNNILTSIMGNAQLLDFRIAAEHPDLRKHLQAILQASESGTGLLQQLLSFTKKEELQMQALSLNQVIEEWRDILLRVGSERISLSTQLSPDLFLIHANADRIKQILMNLVVNARDAMPDGGQIVIETQNVDFQEKKLHKNVPLQGQYYVQMNVRDTGQGMDLPTVARIFDPFFTTKTNGTGLGLTIVKRIVEQMDGFITLQSFPGRGTMFMIFIPCYQEPEKNSQLAGSECIVYGNGEKILLVEDDPEVREMLLVLLGEYMKYKLLPARNGIEALKLLEKTSVSLVITDIRMDGMDGIALASNIRSQHPELADKIIGITACTEYSETYLKEIGFRELIYKPIKAGFLSRAIKKYL